MSSFPKGSSAVLYEDSSEEIVALVRTLHETQQRLLELTDGEIDAVTLPGGQYYLLNDAQEKLRLSEERFQGMYAAAATGIAISTLDGHYLQANAAYCRMLGYTEEELKTLDFAALTHPEDLSSNLTIRDEILSGQRESFVIEKRYLKKGGHTIWARASVSATHGPGGEIDTLIVMAEDITEARKSQEGLVLFRTLIDRSPDAIEVIESSTGQFLDVNETGCQRLGYRREELLSMNVSEVDSGKSLLVWPDAVAAVKKNTFVMLESRHRRKDGSTFPVEIYTRYIDLNQGYVVAVVRDITERKKSEARFRLLVDSNAQGVIFWNTAGTINGANDAFLNLVHYTREDLEAGRINWVELTPPEYADLDASALEQIADHGVCTPYEKEFIRKDGSRTPILLGAATFSDNPSEGVCFVLDLTERKRAEQINIEQAALLDKTRDAIMVRDLDGKVLFWNKGAEGMYGWAAKDTMGRKTPDFLYSKPEKFKEFNDLTVNQGEWNGEIRQLTNAGVEIIVEARWTLIRDKEGRPKSILAINTDITERKKIEQQFLRAQRMESIGTLAGGVAHDLNNILAPILMAIEILKLSAPDDETEAILKTIETSARRGANIVRQVLSFARGLESEMIEVQPKYVLQEIESIVRETFPKNIHFQFSIPDDVWAIEGDQTQIHQILLNLSVNARDAMPSGGNLSVSVGNCVLDEHYSAMNLKAKAGPYVMINVTDSGAGMPQGTIDKIFEPFFTTKELSKGTGLGLSTVMAIVKSHKGVINVYSEVGRGSTFKVYLPAMRASSEGQGPDEDKTLRRGNGQTILVVDDETAILTITAKTLRAFGYNVITATDGAEAVGLYAQHQDQIAAVLTDMTMPIMNGMATIRALVRINPTVKVIAASGLTANGDAEKLLETGVRHSLVKPYTAESLLKVLDEILNPT